MFVRCYYVKLTELGDQQCHLVAELNNMTAALVLDDDQSLPCEEMKLRRTSGSSQPWSWYWLHDDTSWRSYDNVCSIHSTLCYCQHSGVNLVALKPSP